MGICSLLPSPNTELQLPNSDNCILVRRICEPNVLKLCLTLWASAVLVTVSEDSEAEDSAHPAQHPE